MRISAEVTRGLTPRERNVVVREYEATGGVRRALYCRLERPKGHRYFSVTESDDRVRERLESAVYPARSWETACAEAVVVLTLALERGEV